MLPPASKEPMIGAAFTVLYPKTVGRSDTPRSRFPKVSPSPPTKVIVLYASPVAWRMFVPSTVASVFAKSPSPIPLPT